MEDGSSMPSGLICFTVTVVAEWNSFTGLPQR